MTGNQSIASAGAVTHLQVARGSISSDRHSEPVSIIREIGGNRERNTMTNWHSVSVDDALARTGSRAAGLSQEEVQERLREHGPNELTEAGAKNPWLILLEQFTSLLIIILIIAAAISAVLGDLEDAIAIVAIVILNGFLGFRQEYKAEKTMSALRKLAAPVVRVRRDGRVTEIPAANLAPGDVVLLEAGNLIPADARLIVSAGLRVQEAALTGESEPVEKTTDPLPQEDVPLADRLNMVFMGTAATYGRGEAVVVATGMDTELGRIAGMIQGAKVETTPLQKRLAQLGKWLAVAALVLVAVIFAEGLLRGEDVRVMFLTAVSMAVAAVPEGLPAIVTVSLSLGAQRMLKRRALIRRLPAVETLGSVTVICSDKTGTLTENRMTVVILDVAGHEVNLMQEMRRGRPAPLAAMDAGRAADLLQDKPSVALLAAGGVLCNDSVLQPTSVGRTSDEASEQFRALGDPTESALVIAGAQLGILKPHLEASFPRVGKSFDSDRKLATTVHARPSRRFSVWRSWRTSWQLKTPLVSFTKGALDSLLPRCGGVWDGERVTPLNDMAPGEDRPRQPRSGPGRDTRAGRGIQGPTRGSARTAGRLGRGRAAGGTGGHDRSGPT